MPPTSWTECKSISTEGPALEGVKILGQIEGELLQDRWHCQATVRLEGEWTLFEQWTARVLVAFPEGLRPEEIADLLGVHATFLQPAVQQLEEDGLLTAEKSAVRPASGLQDSVERGTRAKTADQEFFASRMQGADSFELMNGRRDRQSLLKLKQHPEITGQALKAWATNPGGPLHTTDVQAIRTLRHEKKMIPVRLEVYWDPASATWGWEARDARTNEIRSDWRRLCENLGAHEPCRKLAQRVIGEGSDPEETAALDSQGQNWSPRHHLAVAATEVEHLDTRQAQEYLLKVLAEAEDEVLMFLPWIKSRGLRAIEPQLRAAVNRGVRILIGYGIANDESKEDSHRDVLDRLRSIWNTDDTNTICVQWLGGCHTKELLVDRKIYVQGSHNLFSYQGSSSDRDGIRREQMTVHRRREHFEPAMISLRKFLLDRLPTAPDGQEAEGMRAWVRHHQPRLHLGAGADSLQAALSSYPSGATNPALPVRLALMGLDFSPSQAAVDEVMALLRTWLSERLSTANSPRTHKGLRKALAMPTLHPEHRARWAAILDEITGQP